MKMINVLFRFLSTTEADDLFTDFGNIVIGIIFWSIVLFILGIFILIWIIKAIVRSSARAVYEERDRWEED